MSTATAGRRREWLVRDAMTDHGWEIIARSAGSKGPADLVMAHEEYGVALVQVGARSKTLGPTDRRRLLHAAALCSALPLLAVVIPRLGIQWWVVGEGPAATWDKWTLEGGAP